MDAVKHATTARYVWRERHALETVAAAMSVPATATTVATDWNEAVQQALDQHHPLLLIAGLTATGGLLDEWISNRALPLAHETGYPLLLVPEHLPTAALRLPRCLALAVRNQAFTMTPEAQALRPLLAAPDATVVPTTIARPNEPNAGRHVLTAAQECGLTPGLVGSSLYWVSGRGARGRSAANRRELSADVLVLLDPSHG